MVRHHMETKRCLGPFSSWYLLKLNSKSDQRSKFMIFYSPKDLLALFFVSLFTVTLPAPADDPVPLPSPAYGPATPSAPVNDSATLRATTEIEKPDRLPSTAVLQVLATKPHTPSAPPNSKPDVAHQQADHHPHLAVDDFVVVAVEERQRTVHFYAKVLAVDDDELKIVQKPGTDIFSWADTAWLVVADVVRKIPCPTWAPG